MLMVNRSKPSDGQVHINSLGFLGLLYGGNRDQLKEIRERKPLDILASVAVPVFGSKNQHQIFMNMD
jgi:ATP adenylyltransferase/5',5'''-P-1,P-4-tetraphosphate phosphorylase II